jgi:predicted dehydrogenase
VTLKVAIVGCGKIADGHIEEIQKLPAAARVVAVADLELLMAEQIATRYGVAAFYDDIDQLLAKERPDVVHITTPPQSHLPLAIKAMDAGAHVYVEKPLTLSYPDSKRLVDYARRAGKKLTIGYSYYFDPPVIALRELVAQGVLGEAVHVEAALGYNLAGPFGKAILGDGDHWVHRLPGKLIQNNLDHILYKLPEFLPDPRTDEAFEADPLGDCRIMVSAWIRRTQRFGDVRDNMLDEMRVTLQSGGASAYATFSAHVKPVGHYTRVYGTKSSAHVDHGMRTLTFESQSALPSAFGRLAPAFDQGAQFLREGGRNLLHFARNEFHFFTGMNTLFARFYASIVEDGPPPIAYRDILRVAAWMDEIFRQAPQDGSAAPQHGRHA